MECDPQLAFELGFPDGNRVRLYMNGHCDGVPPGTIVINWAAQHLLALHANSMLSGLVPDNPPPQTTQEVPKPP